MKNIFLVSYLLVIIGAINWGLIGLFNFNLVAALFGEASILSNSVYSIVGIAAISNIIIFLLKKDKYCYNQ